MHLRSGTPGGAGHDALSRALLRLGLGLFLRRVNPEDLRALLPAHLLNLEVINRPRFLHPIQRLHIRCAAGPRYTPQTEHTANTAAIGVNAAAIAALQGQVAALPAVPDLTPYALSADLAAAEGSIVANASGLVAVNTSLTQGLATKANQSGLDALQVEVNGKSTPASVDLKLANHPTTAAMNSSIASANNATLASVAATYALKTVVDPPDRSPDRQTAADVDQRVATALLAYVQQAALDAALALRDGRLDGHDADILALQSAGPFALPSEITALQAAIDSILRRLSPLEVRPIWSMLRRGPARLPGTCWPGLTRSATCTPRVP